MRWGILVAKIFHGKMLCRRRCWYLKLGTWLDLIRNNGKCFLINLLNKSSSEVKEKYDEGSQNNVYTFWLMAKSRFVTPSPPLSLTHACLCYFKFRKIVYIHYEYTGCAIINSASNSSLLNNFWTSVFIFAKFMPKKPYKFASYSQIVFNVTIVCTTVSNLNLNEKIIVLSRFSNTIRSKEMF